jgi:colicin import membrane protein
MRTALAISASVHAAVLLWGLVSFGVKPLEAGAVESLPVDIISDTEFSQLTAGVRTAAKVETPKPLVEKIDTPKPVEESTPKVAPKPEIRTASAEPMPIPEVKPPEKPEKAKAEPEPKPEKAEPEPDPVAEALKKDEAKRKEEAKKREEQKRRDEAKKREEAKKLEEAKKKEQAFDPNKIAALLDKRSPQRQAAAGDVLNPTASLGLPGGTSATLTQNEIDALRAQIQACWNPPAGALEAKELIVRVRLQLRQDGALSADPILLNRGGHPIFQIAAESALRAIKRCQPYKLPLAKYDVWKDVEVTFDPRDMFRG